MEFKSRLTAPAKNNKHYYSDSNAFYRSGYGMPNCTAYAHGRVAEITGKFPQIFGNAEDWYGAAQKAGYETGNTPKLGAIICWRAGQTGNGADGAGHVAVVEQVKANGDIVTSNSAWKGTEFYTQTLTKASGYMYDSTRPLLGFIYCGLEFDSETADATEEIVNIAADAKTAPESVAVLAAGEKILLKDTPCYENESSAASYGKKSGTYFLWDNEARNGRIRITNSAARVGKTGQVTCWINLKDVSLSEIAEVKAEAAAAQGDRQNVVAKPAYQCIHTVKAGDSLWGLAERYLGKGSLYVEIAKLNNLKSTTILKGQELKIPNR